MATVTTGCDITVNRKMFLAAVNAVAGVAPTRTPKPILQWIKFKAESPTWSTQGSDAGPVLMANDLEIGIRHRVSGVQVREPGEMMLNPVQIKEILAKAKCEELSIYSEGDKVKIRGPKVKYDLASQDPQLFPEPPDFDAESYHVISPGNFRQAINRVMYAATDEANISVSYALGGVQLVLTSDKLLAAATDGRRLSEATVELETIGSPSEFTPKNKTSPTMTRQFLGHVLKSVADTDPPIHIAVYPESAVIIRTEDSTIYGRILSGRFPIYEAVFGQPTAAKMKLPAGPFREAIEQAAITRDMESRAIYFSFSEGKVLMSAQASDVGSSEVEMALGYSGPAVKVAYDPRFVLEPLKALGDDATIEFQADPKGASYITVDGFRASMAPITVSEKK